MKVLIPLAAVALALGEVDIFFLGGIEVALTCAARVEVGCVSWVESESVERVPFTSSSITIACPDAICHVQFQTVTRAVPCYMVQNENKFKCTRNNMKTES